MNVISEKEYIVLGDEVQRLRDQNDHFDEELESNLKRYEEVRARDVSNSIDDLIIDYLRDKLLYYQQSAVYWDITQGITDRIKYMQNNRARVPKKPSQKCQIDGCEERARWQTWRNEQPKLVCWDH